MLNDEVMTWLIDSGFPATSTLTELKRGLGANAIWQLVPSPADPPLVVRLFGEGRHAWAERERVAMQVALAHGIPSPAILAEGVIGQRPVMVTTFMPGQLAFAVMQAAPETAQAIGLALGDTLGHLHQVPAPATLLANDWIALAGGTIEPLRHLLITLPRQNRLLHLDYHPLNVMVQGTTVSGVIDWENTAAGPPHADLARTRSILRMTVLGNMLPPEASGVVESFTTALVTAHNRVQGLAPLPAALTAWGWAMTANDLRRQLEKPGSPVSPTALAALESERDEAIARALATAGR